MYKRQTQYLARDPLEERAIIEQLYAASQGKTWIGFNTEAFDIKRIQARAHTLREPEKHLDLYVLLKSALHGKGFQKKTLQELELSLFHHSRTNDIAGREIGPAYREYLAGGSPDRLVRAVTHNREDIITLAALYAKAVLDKN